MYKLKNNRYNGTISHFLPPPHTHTVVAQLARVLHFKTSLPNSPTQAGFFPLSRSGYCASLRKWDGVGDILAVQRSMIMSMHLLMLGKYSLAIASPTYD